MRQSTSVPSTFLDDNENDMHINKDAVDVKMEIPGAAIRQQLDFGDATGYGEISGEYFTLSEGVDTRPLFEGLAGTVCHSPSLIDSRRRGLFAGSRRRPATPCRGTAATHAHAALKPHERRRYWLLNCTGAEFVQLRLLPSAPARTSVNSSGQEPN